VVPRKTCSEEGREPWFARVCYWMERQEADSQSRRAAIASWLSFAELLTCHGFGSEEIGHVAGNGKTQILEERCAFDGTDNCW
jgi:hypothetical protein